MADEKGTKKVLSDEDKRKIIDEKLIPILMDIATKNKGMKFKCNFERDDHKYFELLIEEFVDINKAENKVAIRFDFQSEKRRESIHPYVYLAYGFPRKTKEGRKTTIYIPKNGDLDNFFLGAKNPTHEKNLKIPGRKIPKGNPGEPAETYLSEISSKGYIRSEYCSLYKFVKQPYISWHDDAFTKLEGDVNAFKKFITEGLEEMLEIYANYKKPKQSKSNGEAK